MMYCSFVCRMVVNPMTHVEMKRETIFNDDIQGVKHATIMIFILGA